MSDSNFEQMRGFIVLAEEYAGLFQPGGHATLLNEVTEAVSVEHPLLQELRDLCFKLRAYVSNEGENAFGMEMGMQRAADMIENLVRRHSEEE